MKSMHFNLLYVLNCYARIRTELDAIFAFLYGIAIYDVIMVDSWTSITRNEYDN